jgi:adenylate cyclase
VLICNNTYARIKDKSLVRELDLIRMRGMETPVAIYEVLAHHTEQTFPNMKAALASFEEGLVLYRGREWGNAQRCFRDALAANPEDGPSRVYLERCDAYLKAPPPVEWDGVWTMKTK